MTRICQPLTHASMFVAHIIPDRFDDKLQTKVYLGSFLGGEILILTKPAVHLSSEYFASL